MLRCAAWRADVLLLHLTIPALATELVQGWDLWQQATAGLAMRLATEAASRSKANLGESTAAM